MTEAQVNLVVFGCTCFVGDPVGWSLCEVLTGRSRRLRHVFNCYLCAVETKGGQEGHG